MYLSVNHPDQIETAFRNYGLGPDEVDLIVATDSEGILGIGDWGVGGIAIAIGKLAVYVAAAGLHPARVVPVVLDAGTDNAALLAEEMYLGNRHPRVRGERYDEMIDAFVAAATRLYPNALLHWEDIGAANARRILARYAGSSCTFNALPRIVLGALFVIILGLGMSSKVVLAAFLVFFVVFFNAYQGVREVDGNLVNNARILGASRMQVVGNVVIPSAMTWIIASLHVAFGFAVIGAVVGEFLGAQHRLA